jgi:hypothetical protein
MIDFQSALKAVQNLIAQQEFVSIRGEIRSLRIKKNWRSTVELRQSLRCCLYFFT